MGGFLSLLGMVLIWWVGTVLSFLSVVTGQRDPLSSRRTTSCAWVLNGDVLNEKEKIARKDMFTFIAGFLISFAMGISFKFFLGK